MKTCEDLWCFVTGPQTWLKERELSHARNLTTLRMWGRCWLGLVITFVQTLIKQLTSSWSFSYISGAKSFWFESWFWSKKGWLQVLGHIQSRAKAPLSKVPNPLHCSECPDSLWSRNSSGPNQHFGIADLKVLPGTQPRDRFWFYKQNKLHLWHLNSPMAPALELSFKSFYLDKLEELNLKCDKFYEKRCLLLRLRLTCLLHLCDS